MSLLISKVFTYDVDAGNYIQAVEAADAQALEPATVLLLMEIYLIRNVMA